MSKANAPLIERTEKISFQFDGVAVNAYSGETIAAALLRAEITHLRDAPSSGTPRGMFCAMGVCQECVVKVDGKIVESCCAVVTKDAIVERVKYV